MSEPQGKKRPERRNGPAERRINSQDRRNPERIADDFAPRRNPEVPDRRKRTREGRPAAAAAEITPAGAGE